MKGKKNLLVVGLLASLVLTGCQKKPEPTPTPGPEEGETESKKVESVTLNKKTLTLEEEGSETLTATISPADAENKGLKWESNNEDVAMVNGLGKVRALTAGTATITVSSVEDPTKKDECVVTVTAKDRTVAVTGISLNAQTLSLDKGEKEVLVATIAPRDATNKEVTWTSSVPAVATVSESGLVDAKAKGQTVITVASVANPQITASCTVTVIDNYIPVNSVRISSTDTHYNADTDTLELQDVDRPLGQLTVTVKGLNDDNQEVDPTNARVTWSVQSGADVVTVSSSGQVTALKVGQAVVRATSEDNTAKFDDVNINVIAESEKDHTVHVDSIAWGADLPTSLNFGEEKSFSVAVSPSNTNYTRVNVTFEGGSLDNTYATLTRVSNNVFKITAKQAVGQVNLVANAEDQVNSPAQIQASISIVDPIVHVTSIELDASLNDLVLFKGDQLDLVSGGKFTVLPAGATNKSVVYNSSNEEVLSVSSSGKLTALKPGTSTITITSVQDNSVSNHFDVTVKNIQVDRIEGIPSEKTMEKDTTFSLTPTVVYKDNTTGGSVSYASNDSTVVSVNANGLLTAHKTGTATITVTATAANTGDPVVSVPCAVTVVDTKPVISAMIKPQSVLNYEQRTLEANLTSTVDLYTQSTMDRGDFYEGSDEELMYKVGDKGLFKYEPTVQARYNGESEDRNYEGTVSFTKTLQVKSGTEYVDADSADYTLEADGVRFNSSAVGKQFKLSVTPASSDNYNIKETIGFSTIEFVVIKGYNAYNLAGLSLFSNVGVSSEHPIDWETYRTENGINAALLDAKDGIVLHNDIIVSEDIIPAGGKFSKAYWDYYLATTSGQSDLTAWMGTIGVTTEEEARAIINDSPKDYQTLLERETNSFDEDFTLEGNFFSVDMSSLKPIVKSDSDSLVDWYNGDGSHAQFFGINASTADRDPINGISTAADKVAFKNFQLIGNGSIATTDQKAIKLAKGGMIGLKTNSVELSLSNVLAHGLFIAFFTEAFNDTQVARGSLDLERTKIYDLYSSAFYFYGTKNNVIDDSWMTQSSGPLFFMDEHKDHGYEWVPGAKFYPVEVDCANTYVNNPVQGNEPWFESHTGADSLVQNYFVDGGDPTVSPVPAQGLPGGWIGLYGMGLYTSEAPETVRNQAKTITLKDGDDRYINFIAADINASHFGDNVYQQLQGYIRIVNGDGTADLSMTKTTKTEIAGHKMPTQLATDVAPIIITGSNGGVAYIGSDFSDHGKEDATNLAQLMTSSYISYYLDPVLGMAQSEAGYFIGILVGAYNIKGNWAA